MSATLPSSYKAVACPGPQEGWNVVQVPMRDPRPHEVLIKVRASGICASDHMVHEGAWPGLQYPRIAGHEVAGRVVRTGSAVDPSGRFKTGTLVGVGWNGGYCGSCKFCRNGDFPACEKGDFTGFTFDGGHAEYIFVPESAVVSIPEEVLETMSYADIAPWFCAGTTVYDAIRTTNWNPGDICLVQGIGGLGHLAIQYASKLGLKVYAVSSGPSKAALAKSLGAYEHIDSSAVNVVEYIQALGGAKVIICTAPYSEHISSILPAVGRNGTITLVSAAVDGNIEVPNLLLNMNRASLRGWSCGAARDMEHCVSFSMMAGVKAMVKEYSFDDFTTAYDDLMQGRAKFRNVIVFPE